MAGETDTQLLARAVQHQDQSAFAQLFDRYKHECFNLAFHLTHNAALAEDAVQDAMLAVWQLKKTPEDGARKWLLAIVANKSLQMIRSRKRSSQREERIVGMTSNQSESAPDSRQEREELMGTLRAQVGKLPPLERQMVALYFGAEISETEIGRMLSLSQTSVSRKLNDALTQLRANLAAHGFASVVPLVGLKALNKAMLSGHDAPHSLSTNVLNALNKKAAKAPSKPSRRNRAPRASSGTPVAGIVLVALAVGIIGYAALSKPAAVPSQSVQPQAAVEPPAVPVTVNPARTPPVPPAPTPPGPPVGKPKFSVRRSWSFNAGPAADLVTYNGDWVWKKQGDVGVMDVPASNTIVLPLPVKLGTEPILIEVVRNGIGRKGSACVNTLWMSGESLLPYMEVMKQRRVDAQSSATRVYVLERYIITLHGGQVSNVYEYEKPFPSETLCLLLQNFSIESILVRSIDPSEIPQELRNVPDVIRQLNEPLVPGKNSGLTMRPN